MSKRRLRVWFSYPFAGAENEEEIIELAPGDDADEWGRRTLETMYSNYVPGGWEILEEDQ